MLPASRKRILAMLAPEDLVLDVGGWAKPLSRADWVIDLMPFKTRGLYGDPDPDPERFDGSSWVQRDFCDHEPWPFADGQFDFAICSHTLEDVRDPIWVCSELNRVARAGYVEVPSRLEEQSRGVHGDWVGWSHHRWLVDVDGTHLQFVSKPHVIHADRHFHFPSGFAAGLSPEDRVLTMFWEGSFTSGERVFVEADELDAYLAGFVERHAGRRDGGVAPRSGGGRRLASRIARRLCR